MIQRSENLSSGSSQIDNSRSMSNGPTMRESAVARHSLRFAEDKTEQLGSKSCRTRSPVLFRWNAFHEAARLT
jgi:hypothetical protein